jgi:hypothetical protein
MENTSYTFQEVAVAKGNPRTAKFRDISIVTIDDKKIVIQNRGSLENKATHDSILNLEGGREAFKLRTKKYQLIEI